MTDSIVDNSEEFQLHLLKIKNFLNAVKDGDIDQVTIRLNEGFDPRLYLKDKTTALHVAADQCNHSLIQLLLGLDIDANFQNF